MNHLIVNSCPLREVNLQQRAYHCLIDNAVCDVSDKRECQKYHVHVPSLDDVAKFQEDIKYSHEKGLVL